MIELNIDTAKRVLGEDGDVEKIREEDIEKSKEEASKTIREVEDHEKQRDFRESSYVNLRDRRTPRTIKLPSFFSFQTPSHTN